MEIFSMFDARREKGLGMWKTKVLQDIVKDKQVIPQKEVGKKCFAREKVQHK